MKKHTGYCGKFKICVLSLNHLDEVPENERKNHNGLYYWAKLFTVKSWEELKMIANEDPRMTSYVTTVRKLSAEEKVAQACEARRRYSNDIATYEEEKRLAIMDILRTICGWKGVEIIEGEVCPDHVHLLLSIPPKMSVSYFVGYLKGKSSLMMFQRFGNMKFAYRNREFWCKGYYVDTVGKNTTAIKEYIANQLERDKEMDQLVLFDLKIHL